LLGAAQPGAPRPGLGISAGEGGEESPGGAGVTRARVSVQISLCVCASASPTPVCVCAARRSMRGAAERSTALHAATQCGGGSACHGTAANGQRCPLPRAGPPASRTRRARPPRSLSKRNPPHTHTHTHGSCRRAWTRCGGRGILCRCRPTARCSHPSTAPPPPPSSPTVLPCPGRDEGGRKRRKREGERGREGGLPARGPRTRSTRLTQARRRAATRRIARTPYSVRRRRSVQCAAPLTPRRICGASRAQSRRSPPFPPRRRNISTCLSLSLSPPLSLSLTHSHTHTQGPYWRGRRTPACAPSRPTGAPTAPDMHLSAGRGGSEGMVVMVVGVVG
jgi:hypothetical protein